MNCYIRVSTILCVVTFAKGLCAVLMVSPPNVDAHVRDKKINVVFLGPSSISCYLICFTGFNIFKTTLPSLGFAMVENFDTLGNPSYGAFVILDDLITLGTIKVYSKVLLRYVTLN